MSLVPIFHGRIDADGRFSLAENERSLRRVHFQSLAGKNVEIVVRKERSKRSLDQNAYWHAVPFMLLADHLGYDSIEELKFDLMGECWGWTQTKAGHRLPMKLHTSELDTEEGSHFTDWMIRFGAMLPGGGVDIPPPEKVSH